MKSHEEDILMKMNKKKNEDDLLKKINVKRGNEKLPFEEITPRALANCESSSLLMAMKVFSKLCIIKV